MPYNGKLDIELSAKNFIALSLTEADNPRDHKVKTGLLGKHEEMKEVPLSLLDIGGPWRGIYLYLELPCKWE